MKILPALDGLRHEKFNLNLPTDLFFPQTGKGDFVVSDNSLTQFPSAVNLFFAG